MPGLVEHTPTQQHYTIGALVKGHRIIYMCIITITVLNIAISNITIKSNTTAHAHQRLEVIQEVQWVRDEAWFQKELEKGCCPFAKTLYQRRFEDVEYRCCTSQLKEGKIDPLRAVGGVDYPQVVYDNKNLTILIQGDSLGEQYFLGMICFAWSAHNYTVDLQRLSGRGSGKEGTIWHARITITRDNKSDAFIVIQFLRWNRPMMFSAWEVNYSLLSVPDYVIVGGWHHGFAGDSWAASIEQFIHQMKTQGIHGLGGHQVIVVDPLPNHLPGGKFLGNGSYPPAIADGVNEFCDQSNSVGDPNIGKELVLIQNQTNVTLLEVSKFYYHRGNAHIGGKLYGAPKRDCLHWCIAPGVMDAFVRTALVAIYNGG